MESLNSIHHVVRWTISLMSLILVVGIGVTNAAASSAVPQQTENKNRQLSVVIQPFGFFDPSYKYLDRGDVFVEDLGNGKLKITVSTEAKSSVKSIGATIQLQKWTGSTWVNAGTSTSKSSSNTWYFQHSTQKSADSGYYYRVKATHWVTHGGTHESEEIVTSSILVQ